MILGKSSCLTSSKQGRLNCCFFVTKLIKVIIEIVDYTNFLTKGLIESMIKETGIKRRKYDTFSKVFYRFNNTIMMIIYNFRCQFVFSDYTGTINYSLVIFRVKFPKYNLVTKSTKVMIKFHLSLPHTKTLEQQQQSNFQM